MATVGRLRIRLKGVRPPSATSGDVQGIRCVDDIGTSSNLVVDDALTSALAGAVEAFCRYGERSLPGGKLLLPWDEPHLDRLPAPACTAQQTDELAQPAEADQQQQQQQMRKRTEPESEPGAALMWGSSKRSRSGAQRAARGAAQLSGSVHSMLQSAPGSPSIVSHAAGAAAAAAPLPLLPPLVPVDKQQQGQHGCEDDQLQVQKQEQQQQVEKQKQQQKQVEARQTCAKQTMQKQVPDVTAAQSNSNKQKQRQKKTSAALVGQGAASSKAAAIQHVEKPTGQEPVAVAAAAAAATAVAAAAAAAATAAVKPDSPPSETSHQLIAGTEPVLTTANASPLQQRHPEPARQAPSASSAGRPVPQQAGGSGGSGCAALLDLVGTSGHQPALCGLAAVPPVRIRHIPSDSKPVRTQEDALQLLTGLMQRAKGLKHTGDRRHSSLGSWDVFGLSHYALAAAEFLLCWDAGGRMLARLRAAGMPCEKLASHVGALAAGGFVRQTGALAATGTAICSNARGPDIAKQALRMLLERLAAICQLRHLHEQRRSLEGHVRALRAAGVGCSGGGGGAAAAVVAVGRPPQQPGAAQQRAASGSRASWSPVQAPAPASAQQQPGSAQSKRSPDDSGASHRSTQERIILPLSGDANAGTTPPPATALLPPAASERAQQLARSERTLVDCMGELLRLTDGMHQTTMRLQQFLESADVLASEHAQAAALHISVLGLDAGLFGVPRVTAHTEAAVTCITKLLRAA